MGSFVKAGQLRPLDAYAKAYGWNARYPESVRQYSSYSPDGKTFGQGSLYGLPQVGEVVGIYYNAKKLEAAGVQPPKTWAEFEPALAAAKAKGEVPIVFGNLDKWPAIHVFGTVQGRTTPRRRDRRSFGVRAARAPRGRRRRTPRPRRPWSTGSTRATSTQGFNGQGYDPAWQAFSKGKGAFLIAGTWLQADLQKAMGADVGFMLPPGRGRRQAGRDRWHGPAVRGHQQERKNPDAAAAYINFITNADAMQVLAETGNLPVADTAAQQVGGGLRRTSSPRSARSSRATGCCRTSTTRRRRCTTPSAPRCRTCWPRRPPRSSSSSGSRRTTATSCPPTAGAQ